MEKKDRSEMEIEQLKENFAVFQKKYNLPDFKILNENFEIENVSIYDTELLLKKIRKQMMEKIYSYLRLFETFLNPSNAPLFIINFLKSFETRDREVLNKLYSQLGELELSSFELEVVYGEDKEAEFIKKIYNLWVNISADLLSLTLFVKKELSSRALKQDKSYFG